MPETGVDVAILNVCAGAAFRLNGPAPENGHNLAIELIGNASNLWLRDTLNCPRAESVSRINVRR